MDSFTDIVIYDGYLDTEYHKLSMPCKLTTNLISSLKDFTFQLLPYLDTMEVSTFYNIFQIP